MIKRLMTYLSSLLLVISLAAGCITYTATQAVQMELPAIHDGEKIIKYAVDDYETQRLCTLCHTILQTSNRFGLLMI